MKRLITFLLFTITLSSFSQNLDPELFYDSLYFFKSDTSGNVWSLTGKMDDLYYVDNVNNENKLLKSHITYRYSAGSWIPDLMKTITYSTAGDPDSTIDKIWDDGAWLNQSLRVDKFNSFHKHTHVKIYDWFAETWRAKRETILTYDYLGNKITHIERYWDPDVDSLLNDYRSTVIRNVSGYPVTQIVEWWSDSLGWYLDSRSTYLYDSSDRNTARIEEDYDNGWDTTFIQTTTYSNDNRLIVRLDKYKFWTFWRNFSLDSTFYDSNGRFLYSIIKHWQNDAWCNWYYLDRQFDQNGNEYYFCQWEWENNKWERMSLYRNSYNEDGKRIASSHRSYWNSFVSGDSTAYYIQSPLEIEKFPIETPTIFPNPCHGYFTINTPSSVDELIIYDLHGRPVKTLHSPGKLIEIKDLVSGVYVVQIVTGSNINSKKLVISD